MFQRARDLKIWLIGSDVASFAKRLSIRLQTKCLWVRIPLLSPRSNKTLAKDCISGKVASHKYVTYSFRKFFLVSLLFILFMYLGLHVSFYFKSEKM